MSGTSMTLFLSTPGSIEAVTLKGSTSSKVKRSETKQTMFCLIESCR
jgi:hypothetical protein